MRPTRRSFALGLPTLPLLGLAPSERPSRAGSRDVRESQTLVVLVRHAEKAAPGEPGGEDARDPKLSGPGRERAQDLARLLRRAGVTHLFASPFRRTRETLEPLSSQAGIEPVLVPAAEVEALASKLRALPGGSVAVVAGHSNTVPAIAQALGARGLRDVEETDRGATLADDEYDRLLVLALAPKDPEAGDAPAPAVLDLSYGA